MSDRVHGFAAALRASTTPLIGTWVKIPALSTVEILADAGFDFVVIDMEHAPLTLEQAYAATVVAQGAGMQVLVRVPDRSGSHLQRLLDSGVDGILVPRVTTAAQAAEAAAAMTFSPAGERGLGTTSRAGRWGGLDSAAYQALGADVMKAVQLEDTGSLEIVSEILDVPHLNGVFLGMGDLQLSSGKKSDSPELQALVTSLLAEAGKRGIPVGTAVQTAEQVEGSFARGFSYVMADNDTGLLRRAATGLVADIRGRLA